jgi:hypothetical protein
MLTVQDLINRLQGLSPEAEVRVGTLFGYFEEAELDANVVQVDVDEQTHYGGWQTVPMVYLGAVRNLGTMPDEALTEMRGND